MLNELKYLPLIEAVCEFRFKSSEKWDWTIPGLLFDKIGTDFPERSQVGKLELNLAPVPTISTRPTIDRVQMISKDRSAMVQVGEHLLTINHFLPYSTWASYLKIIQKVLDEYQRISPEVPFEKVGLRYINKIPVREGVTEINEYIGMSPPLPEKIRQNLRHFYQRYELVHDDPAGILIHQTGFILEMDGKVVHIMLDLDFTSEKVGDVNKASIADWLTKAHTCVENAFIYSMNPELLAKMRG